MATPAESTTCRCDGTGTYTVTIPIADPVVSIQRQCAVHGDPDTPVRDLALDTRTKRVGEVMQAPTERGYWQQYSLRACSGGREWNARPRHVQILDDTHAEPTS